MMSSEPKEMEYIRKVALIGVRPPPFFPASFPLTPPRAQDKSAPTSSSISSPPTNTASPS
jgi:hypothetical protein